MSKLKNSKLKKQYWGSLTNLSLEQNHIYAQLISMDLIIVITKIKSALIDADPYLSREIKLAILSSAEEIIEEKHNKQFPISIYSSNVELNINNNINEVIGYLVKRKIKKDIDISILNLNNGYVNICNNAVSISLIQNINKCLIPAINTLNSFFWAKKHNERNVHQFSRLINLYEDNNKESKKLTTQMSLYNKKLNVQKKSIMEVVTELMILNLPSINIREAIINNLSEKWNLSFTINNATQDFDNIKLWKLNYEIQSLIFIIFQIIKVENINVYKELSQMYSNLNMQERSIIDFLNMKNNLVIHADIIKNINTLLNIIDYFIKA